ncbi:ATP-binding protein [Streptomyces sp. NPDC048479]|uniref:sensor histidine kinase n=1 Tax=Streptomyces sp. NPDC048479 TaxID=3154725 RepID=UPI00341F334D
MTIRRRLTLTYGGFFVVSGAALIGLLYVFMSVGPTYAWPQPPGPGGTSIHETAELQMAPRTSDMATPVQEGLFTTISVEAKSDLLGALLIFSAAALAILTVVALVLGWFLAGRLLDPLERITRAARSVAGANLHERVALDGPQDEIRELADTFDDMLERLDASFEAQQRFAANVSHELRTPLTVIRTVLQVALADPEGHDLKHVGPRLLVINQRSIEVTEALLALARADHGALKIKRVELADVLAEVCRQAEDAAAQHGVTIERDAAPMCVAGDRVLLLQLATNLLDNGIRHNHRHGRVSLQLEQEAAHAVRLTVRSTGRQLRPEEVERIFEPFHRLEPSQASAGQPGGHGLGLAIVQSIVRAHHGTLKAAPLPGGGLEVNVTLPAVGSDQA